MNDSSSLKTGTLCGTFFSLLAAMTWNEIGKTLLSASIGAAASFLVSLLLKKILDYGKDLMGTSNRRPTGMKGMDFYVRPHHQFPRAKRK